MIRVDLALVGDSSDEYISVWIDKSKTAVTNMVIKDIQDNKIWKINTPDKKTAVINMRFVKIIFVQEDDDYPEENQELSRE